MLVVAWPAIQKTPDGSAQAATPTSVGLTASATTVNTGDQVTLTVTADTDVAADGYSIQIWRVAPSYELVEECTTGDTCIGYASLDAQAVKDSTFRATVNPGTPNSYPSTSTAVSTEAEVSRAGYTVSLTSSDSTISTESSDTLTATANQTVTNTDQRIFIYDRTSEMVLASCATGDTCTVGLNIYDEPNHKLVAYVATNIDGSTSTGGPRDEDPVGEEAVSSELTVNRQASLAAAEPTVMTDETAVGVTALVVGAVGSVIVTAGACAGLLITVAGIVYTAYQYGTSDECFDLGDFAKDMAVEVIAGKVVRAGKYVAKGANTIRKAATKDVAETAGSKASKDYERVGRWMSQDEYDKWHQPEKFNMGRAIRLT